MAIITSDDAKEQSSTSSIEPVEHQEASILNNVDSKILEENPLQNRLPVGENLYMLFKNWSLIEILIFKYLSVKKTFPPLRKSRKSL